MIFRPQTKRLGAYGFGVSVHSSVRHSFFVQVRTFEQKVIETLLYAQMKFKICKKHTPSSLGAVGACSCYTNISLLVKGVIGPGHIRLFACSFLTNLSANVCLIETQTYRADRLLFE